MAALLLEVETRDNLGPAVTELLSLPASELTVADLISEQVRGRTAALAQAQQEQAVRQALDAFSRSAFLLIVDGKRRTDPAERVQVTPATHLQFWRLMPLQGG